jgi:hypothetical protein
MSQPLIGFILLLASVPYVAAPPAPKPDKPQKAAPVTVSCSLLTTEAPRGGRLEVEGKNFGRAPVVHIGDRAINRILERTETKISVQIPADSDGGAVTVRAGTQQATCGTLTIIGKN